MIRVDGSHLEGGGQILRTSLGLSAVTGKAFEISNIRKNRSSPGLKPQHISCVKTAAELCNGSFEGCEKGSEQLKFYPRKIKSKNLEADIGTAGSVNLLLQSLLVPALFGGKKFRITARGGTDVPFAPTSAYFMKVLLPNLRKLADKTEYSVKKRGFFPAGGGAIEFFARPKFSLDDFPGFPEFLKELRKTPKFSSNKRKKVLQVRGLSLASSSLEKARVAERQADSARLSLKKLSVPVRIEAAYADSLSPGSSITLWATLGGEDPYDEDSATIGTSLVGSRKLSPEQAGTAAANDLRNQAASMPSADRHLADQLIPFAALAGGRIKAPEITNHCLSSIKVAEKFLGSKFSVAGKEITSHAQALPKTLSSY